MAAALITEDALSPSRTWRSGSSVAYEPSKSLAVGRLTRALRRQWLLALASAVLVGACGIAFDLTGGGSALSSFVFWAPIALVAGLGLGVIRELGRNTVTSLSSLSRHQGYQVAGAAPDLTGRTLRQLPPHRRTPMECVIFQPATAYATAFRELQAELDSARVVSFLGALPGEGASTSALCAAASAAMQGRSVILVDCDLRGRSLTRALVQDAEEGVLEAAQGSSSWRTMLAEEAETGFHFLPAARSPSAWKSLSGMPGFIDLLDDLSKVYDLVVLDCPPALATADGAMIAASANRCVLVVSWDRTPLQAVRATIRAVSAKHGATTSVFVNRLPPGYRFGQRPPD